MSTGTPEVEEVWQTFWKPLVMVGSKVSTEAVKRELYDFHFLMEQSSSVYSHVSGGTVSKTNTYAFEVIREADSRVEEAIEEALDEACAMLEHQKQEPTP